MITYNLAAVFSDTARPCKGGGGGAGVALGFKIRGWMTSEAAREKKMGVKMQTLRVTTCSGISTNSKQGGHE